MARAIQRIRLKLLLRLCLRGHGRAWKELARRTRPAQLEFIRHALARYGICDANEVERFVNEVFSSLLEGNGRKLRVFLREQQAGNAGPVSQEGLDRFLARLAGDLIKSCVRAQKTRRRREDEGGLQKLQDQTAAISENSAAEGWYQEALAELAAGLPPALQESMWSAVAAGPSADAGTISQTAFWQRTSRLRKRLEKLLGLKRRSRAGQ